MSKEIKEIIERMRVGKEPTQQERNQIQQWVQETTISVNFGMVEIIEDIQFLFPEEYGNAIEEKEEDEDLMVGSYLTTFPKSHIEDAMEDDQECEEIIGSFLETCPNCHQDYDDADFDFQICHYCWWDAKINQYKNHHRKN